MRRALIVSTLVIVAALPASAAVVWAASPRSTASTRPAAWISTANTSAAAPGTLARTAPGTQPSTRPPAAPPAVSPPAVAPPRRAAVPRRGADPTTQTSGLFAEPESEARRWVSANRGDARSARITAAIASQPVAKWFGAWSNPVGQTVSAYVGQADRADKLPVLVAYNLPGRDACGGHSGGGAGSPGEYRKWISAFAAAIGRRPAVVIIEPDALGDFGCMNAGQIAARNELLTFATAQFRQKAPNTWAYLDGGNANWVPADVMADRLHAAGVGNIRGFALNISNYYTTAQTAAYGSAVNKNLARRGYRRTFVVDTSRNGNGANGEWCNPAGRKLGAAPRVGGGGAEMLLWVKTPGASDGNCGIAPGVPAGTFSPEIALRLIDGR